MPSLADLYSKNILNLAFDRLVGMDKGPANHPEQATETETAERFRVSAAALADTTS